MASKNILILLGLLCLMLALFEIRTGISVWQDGHASVNWPSIKGKVIDSRVNQINRRRRRGGRTTSYRVEVEYEYVVENVTYRGNRVSFGASPGGRGDAGHAEAYRASGRYSITNNLQVYYDSDDPSHSVLEPGPGSEHRLPLTVGILFLLAAMAFAHLFLQPQANQHN